MSGWMTVRYRPAGTRKSRIREGCPAPRAVDDQVAGSGPQRSTQAARVWAPTFCRTIGSPVSGCRTVLAYWSTSMPMTPAGMRSATELSARPLLAHRAMSSGVVSRPASPVKPSGGGVLPWCGTGMTAGHPAEAYSAAAEAYTGRLLTRHPLLPAVADMGGERHIGSPHTGWVPSGDGAGGVGGPAESGGTSGLVQARG
jgi:hypothetical protein